MVSGGLVSEGGEEEKGDGKVEQGRGEGELRRFSGRRKVRGRIQRRRGCSDRPPFPSCPSCPGVSGCGRAEAGKEGVEIEIAKVKVWRVGRRWDGCRLISAEQLSAQRLRTWCNSRRIDGAKEGVELVGAHHRRRVKGRRAAHRCAR